MLAYGQTGSGKTFTMGTGFDVDLPPDLEGVVPRAVKYLFARIQKLVKEAKGGVAPEISVSVSFMELYRNTFYDLFDVSQGSGKHASNIKILDERAEDGTTTVRITNISQLKVESVEELMERLRIGSMERVTKSTDMNATSSRSHAIFTLYVTHQRVVPDASGGAAVAAAAAEATAAAGAAGATTAAEATEGAAGSLITTTAKFNFVDLAGSERLKRTGATGDRAKEGIDINSGLLALGNVISALGDVAKRGSHVPYRDSKLTRILQDSLGGNSRTVMIACVSPCDRDFIETLNTLKYANRTRNIKNKVVINQDSASRQIQMLHETIAKLTREVTMYRQGNAMVTGGLDAEDAMIEFQHLRDENESLKERAKWLKSENTLLKTKVADFNLDGRDPSKVVEGVGGEKVPLGDLVQQYTAMQTKLEAAEAIIKEGFSSSAHSSPVRPTGLWRDRPATSSNSLVEDSQVAIQRGRTALALIAASDAVGDGGKDNGEADDYDSDADSDAGEEGGSGGRDVDVGEDDGMSQDEEYHSQDDDGGSSKKAPDVDTSIDVETTKDLLVDELGKQIEVQEQLLHELQTKENELQRQRELYEARLVSIKREKEKYAIECAKIKAKASSLSGNNGTEAKRLKKEYKHQIKEMESKIKSMTQQARQRDRDVEQQKRISQQMDTMKQNLDSAKQQRRKLVQQTKEERKKIRAREQEQSKKLVKLQKIDSQNAVKTKRLEDQFHKTKAQMMKLEAENEKLKAEQRRAREMQRRQATATVVAVAGEKQSLDNVSPDSKGSRRSRRMSIVKARRKHVMLVKEVDRAVLLTSARTGAEELIQRRDQLADERKKLVAAKRSTADPAAEVQLDLELDRCKTETELLSETIEERQQELVRMDESGARSCASVHDLTAESELIITSSSKRESHEMLKRLLCAMVQFEINASQDRIRAKQAEIYLREKDALLKSLIAGGVSTSDSPLKKAKPEGGGGGGSAESPSRARSASDAKSPLRRNIGKSGGSRNNADLTVTDEHGVFQGSLRGGGEKKIHPKRMPAVDERIVTERPPSKQTSLTHTHTIVGHGDEVISAAVNGNILLTGSKDKILRVWDVTQSGAPIAKLADHENKVTRVVHAGASFISASRNIVRVWDAQSHACTEKIVLKGDGDIREMEVSEANRNHLVVTTDKTLRIYDVRKVAAGKPLREVKHKGKVGCLQQIGANVLAVGSMNNVAIYPNFLDVESSMDSMYNMSPPHYNSVISLARCGRFLVSGSKDFSIKRWQLDPTTQQWSQGQSLKSAHDAHVTALVGLPGGDAVMGGSAKGVIRIWSVADLKLRTEGEAHSAAINQLVCSGETIYSASSDRTVKVWQYRGKGGSAAAAAVDVGGGGGVADEGPIDADLDDEDGVSFTTSLNAPFDPSVTQSLPLRGAPRSRVGKDSRRLTYNLDDGEIPLNLNSTFDLSSPGGAKLAWNAKGDILRESK